MLFGDVFWHGGGSPQLSGCPSRGWDPDAAGPQELWAVPKALYRQAKHLGNDLRVSATSVFSPEVHLLVPLGQSSVVGRLPSPRCV